MNCPKCGVYMSHFEYEGIGIETCRGCGGEWLDHDELLKITKIREEKFDEETRRAVARSASYPGVPASELERTVVCPKCGQNTAPVNYAGGSGIIVDKCPGCHGFWLDDGELESVQMVVEGWEDELPADLASHRETLHDVSVGTAALDRTRDMQHSAIPIVGPFINACVNGVLNVLD